MLREVLTIMTGKPSHTKRAGGQSWREIISAINPFKILYVSANSNKSNYRLKENTLCHDLIHYQPIADVVNFHNKQVKVDSFH